MLCSIATTKNQRSLGEEEYSSYAATTLSPCCTNFHRLSASCTAYYWLGDWMNFLFRIECMSTPDAIVADTPAAAGVNPSRAQPDCKRVWLFSSDNNFRQNSHVFPKEAPDRSDDDFNH